MGQMSAIEWTDATWNPVVGCTKISEGCRHCYAKTLHDQRHKAFKEGKKIPLQYAEPFEKVQLMPDRLGDPLSWKKPRRVFVNSVSDLFHKDVPDEFLDRTFASMAIASWHTFQVLTKRADRMETYLAAPGLGMRLYSVVQKWLDEGEQGLLGKKWDHTHSLAGWAADIERSGWNLPLPNVWLGTSVENQAAADERIPHLLRTPAAVRFLSLEPLLGPVDLKVWMHECITTGCGDRIDGCIVGGESGHGARPIHPDWARSLRDQCTAAGVAFFHKQWGEWAPYSKSLSGPLADRNLLFDGNHFVKWTGRDWMPNLLDDSGEQVMIRVGKKAAGRLLDGREWSEFPGTEAKS